MDHIAHLASDAVLPKGWTFVDGPERDAHYQPLNDAVWGPGNWVKCDLCPVDDAGNPPYHHKNHHS